MTGAAIPADCNAVVMLELTEGFEKNGKTYMKLKRPFIVATMCHLKGRYKTKSSSRSERCCN